jgi:hypothetical protein
MHLIQGHDYMQRSLFTSPAAAQLHTHAAQILRKQQQLVSNTTAVRAETALARGSRCGRRTSTAAGGMVSLRTRACSASVDGYLSRSSVTQISSGGNGRTSGAW